MSDFLRFLQGRPSNLQAERKWYNLAPNTATGEAEVFLYDVIGESWFGGITAKDFVRDLRAVEADKLVIRINSPGGDITDGVAIRNALLEHPAKEKETHIDGMAASTASWLPVGNVIMSPGAVMMIHEPYNIVMGDAESFRKQAEILDMFGDNIADMYAERAGGKREDWRDLMRAETWYTDQGAVDAGLANEVAGKAVVENRYDPNYLNVYRNVPKHLLERAAVQPEPRVDLLPGYLAYQRNRARLMGFG